MPDAVGVGSDVIDFDGDEPLYAQLAAILRAQIESGELPPRRPIPSKKTLMQRYGVSQGTVERTLAQLRAEGLIRTVMGRGIYVAPQDQRH